MRYRNKALSPSQRDQALSLARTELTRLGETPAEVIIRSSLLKKLKSTTIDPSLALKAKTVFLETERQCSATNARIRSLWTSHKDYARSNVMYVASRKIRSILGRFSLTEMLNLGRFGPGSTFSCSGEDVSVARKFSQTDVTPEFQKLASSMLSEYPLWAEALTDCSGLVCPLLTVVPGGRHSTVPKDARIDRNIIVEPTINSFFQQALGRMIRARLLSKCGVDLTDQTVNRRLAAYGSIHDDLATVDLSNASDLLSANLVKDLLPDEWYYWLDATRSHRCLIDGEWLELEKFSSMGNGFTFDLESLIFYGLAYAVTVTEGFNPFWVNVFGDDIVVPSAVEKTLIEVFSDCGFSINIEKSYFRGPFRESCGHDYYKGQNVRGVYIKSIASSFDCLKIYNRLRAWTRVHGVHLFQELRVFLSALCAGLPRVPVHLGDVGLHSSFDECRPSVARDGWEGFRITVMKPVFLKKERSDRFLNLSRLFSITGRDWAGQSNSVQLRREPIGFTSLVITSHWEEPAI